MPASGGGAPRELKTVDLVSIAQEFSPRYEQHGDDLVVIDVRGLERLLGSPRTIAHELRREAADRGMLVHVALAGTQTAAIVLALARPGLTVIEPGSESSALAPLSLETLARVFAAIQGPDFFYLPGAPPPGLMPSRRCARAYPEQDAADRCRSLETFRSWGLKTLGELAALPAADLSARLGQHGLACQAIARGEDLRPLVPTLAEERFESFHELDWPIAELEPLSFVLTRLLEPLVTRLERRDRGVAVLHVLLHLVTRDIHARHLELAVPLRDVRTLRALALIDLESHPPPASIDIVTVVIDPTPGRVLQHKLFARACPTPDAISTLQARLGALLGQDRIGAPSIVDSYRPGAFVMKPFALDHSDASPRLHRPQLGMAAGAAIQNPEARGPSPESLLSALRRCRQPVPARVVTADGRPVRVTTDRRSYTGGAVLACAGPWLTSGSWWTEEAGRAGEAGGDGGQGRPVLDMPERNGARASGLGVGPQASEKKVGPHASNERWSHEEWDVALADGAIYRIFRDCETDGWFIDGIVD